MERNWPITEKPNDLTQNIDIASSEEIFNLLGKCDLEIFDGWGENYPSLQDEKMLAKIETISQIATEVLHHDNSSIVLSGCGTSGRMAFLAARNLQDLWTKNENDLSNKHIRKFEYLIAGGDVALFTSQEAPEDDFEVGRELLEELVASRSKVLFIGITCGMSAAFIAGQLDFCLQHNDKCIPVLLGFNPVDLARSQPMRGQGKSFRDVARQVEAQGYVLNPVIGPEPITGSSRMKGGTATKMILDCIFIPAFAKYMNLSNISTPQLLNLYKKTHQITYLSPTSHLATMAAKSLQNNGRIFYLGWDSEGIFSLIDASECVPTFGAKFEDIRAFVHKGFDTLRNQEGDLSDVGEQMNISVDNFVKTIAPSLSKWDTVYFVNSPVKDNESYLEEIVKLVKQSGAVCASISVSTQGQAVKNNMLSVFINLSELCLMVSELCTGSDCIQSLVLQNLREIAYKWLLNYISTGAHILLGKVCNNLMVDVKLSNVKLFHRGVSIVSTLAKVPTGTAYQCILRAILSTECLDNEVENEDLSLLVKKASVMDKIVPKAILLASNKCSLSDAESALKGNSVVRLCMLENL